jgi:AraC family transcriptional regulator, regulatory protein of adaptative response / methylated-DNA-[protein]-cysteine methyltransferase
MMLPALTTSDSMARLFDDDPRWAQVLARSAAAEGRFVYAVKSTGVFCRPTCPSRRPRREQVLFYDHPAEAERAGFRSCLRCRPDGARPVTEGAKAVARTAAYLRRHADEPVELPDLAALTGLSPSHLQRAFTAHTGISPRQFQAACRAQRFRASLRDGHDVTTATYEAGYGSPSRVSAHKPTGRGLTPAAYRRRGDGVAIGYTVVPCSLGRLLIAATPSGVCAVRLGSSDRALVEGLREEFPKAAVTQSAPPAAWISTIARAAEGAPGAIPGVPLDIQGTAFQWTVWKALQAIPAGETRTYAEVARAVGRPRAVRAVARACASNPVALVVPCHRVLPKAGDVGGYRWGAERKRALLDRESAPAQRRTATR